MRREPDHFGDLEPTLIHVATKLKHALKLEQALTSAGIDYLVEPDHYLAGAIWRTKRVGAFFYVAPRDEDAASDVVREEGFKPYAEQHLRLCESVVG
jgi:hypothetical protein